MPEPEIDPGTLLQCARGDRGASTRFVARYQGLVFAVCGRVLGRTSRDVEDCAQEAFLRAFGALATFDPAGPARLSSWLATIATRVALDAVRRRRGDVVSLDEARDAIDPRAVDPGEQLDAARRRARLAAAVERLGADQRAAMVLRAEHGMSYEAIAQALGVEVGTVKSRLGRARAALLAAVGDDEDVARHQHG